MPTHRAPIRHSQSARLALALLPIVAITALGAAPAGAIPEDFVPAGTAPEYAAPTSEPGQGRPCFMVRSSWNVTLDGPQPRC